MFSGKRHTKSFKVSKRILRTIIFGFEWQFFKLLKAVMSAVLGEKLYSVTFKTSKVRVNWEDGNPMKFQIQ